jgi:hypothetical protein
LLVESPRSITSFASCIFLGLTVVLASDRTAGWHYFRIAPKTPMLQ